MHAAFFDQFRAPIRLEQVPDPTPGPGDVVVRVCATGICRSDWHGWQGHDSDVRLPHVPGHELAGVVEAVGAGVRHWRPGDRVTVPFCVGCGHCPQCAAGQQQICDQYFQPGFTAWGSFAEFVNIRYADHNLVRLPESMAFTTAAVLGCRFITAWRGVTAQGRVRGGEWVAVHGCGGVGLSAILIAAAFGAQPIAVDIDDEKLALARSLGAVATVNARQSADVVAELKHHSKGGAHLSIDALGSRETCRNSILGLRKQGRHVQLGLLAGAEADPALPMSAVISGELEIIGSHGMQAHRFPEMLDMIVSGQIQPERMLGKVVSLADGIRELMDLNSFRNTGVTVIGM
ncbi:MAG: zinc-dependent alcohol dehydrogenase family protein [Saprospiraceae bacterium]|nr:zinc-dependent alcohol dehydrogenase family protein [Saprospiraceae bacterium]